MLLRIALLWTFSFCLVKAYLSGKEIHRREAGFISFGPPQWSGPQHGASLNQVPHRVYGVPQKKPLEEYGPPVLKYVPPQLNYCCEALGSSSMNGLYEQIKTHFGVPKPFYGPPHIQPKLQHSLQYDLKPVPQYSSAPSRIQQSPALHYGLPLQKPPLLTPVTPLHSISQLIPAVYKPVRVPATSYGPPASGPLKFSHQPVYETPPNYGPPPLPVNLPIPKSPTLNSVPETTILLQNPEQNQSTGSVSILKQAQIQIDASGHTHSVTGSQTPFHTACDGWKPIPAPIGTYIKQNHIETPGVYSHVSQGQSSHTQYNTGSGTNSSIFDGLSDEQLVAVALQGGTTHPITISNTEDDLNTINSNNLQILNLKTQYDSQNGTPQFGDGLPKSPVAFRAPVPSGLIESIGATVQHLDEHGVKPPHQTAFYIPPAVREIALIGPHSQQDIYTASLNQQVPQVIVQQQLPQAHQGQSFVHGLSDKQLFSHHVARYNQHPKNSNIIFQNMQSVDNVQALPSTQKNSLSEPNPSQIMLHDCGQGPNLVSNSGLQVHQQQQLGSISEAFPGAYNRITQSVPVAEEHTQFIVSPTESYGSPTLENEIEFDHSGYASQRSPITASPDKADLEQLSGLDGLNVISTQKSQSIHFGTDTRQPVLNFQLQFDSSINDDPSNQDNVADVIMNSNHEELLSQGLLQSILTAIEQPQSATSIPQNYRAQNRSDHRYQEDANRQQQQKKWQHARQYDVSERVHISHDTNVKEVKHNKSKTMDPIVVPDVEKEVKH